MRASDALHLSTTPSRLYIQIVHVFVFLPLTRQSQCVLLTPYICQQHLADCTYVVCVCICVSCTHMLSVCVYVCVYVCPVRTRYLCVYMCVRTRHACRLLHSCLHTLSVCV